MKTDGLPIKKLHDLVDHLSELEPEKQNEFLNKLMEELESDFRRRTQPPVDWILVLDRLIVLVDKYLEIKKGI